MTPETRMIEELVGTARRGRNETVRQNALDLLYKLAADGLRAARQAIEAIERQGPRAQQRP